MRHSFLHGENTCVYCLKGIETKGSRTIKGLPLPFHVGDGDAIPAGRHAWHRVCWAKFSPGWKKEREKKRRAFWNVPEGVNI